MAMTAKREELVAWSGAAVAAAYFMWVGVSLSRGAQSMAALMESLGGVVPASTQFVIDHRMWLPVVYGAGAILVVAKELAIRDKRFSMAVTMLAFIVFRVAADAILRLYYSPVLDLMKQLS